MRCSQQCHPAQRRRRLDAAAAQVKSSNANQAAGASPPPSVLSGTWDFKWSSGTKLRVAFQRLPRDVQSFEAEFKTARALVLKKLDQWLSGSSGPAGAVARPNISYEVVADLPPPPLHAGDSPRSAKSEVRFSGFIEYDVLVSFLSLPVCLPATEQHPEDIVSTAASELGRYAHRIEYGVPTAYLGPQPGLSASEWFQSPEGIFTVAHELGHVLGMAHEQQNPLLPSLPWRPTDEMVEILENREGSMLNEDIVDVLRAEITDPWPGEVQFSDWRAPPPGLEHGLASIMARPLYMCLLRGAHPGGFDCRKLKKCPHEQQAIQALQGPTINDLRHLVAMYGAALA